MSMKAINSKMDTGHKAMYVYTVCLYCICIGVSKRKSSRDEEAPFLGSAMHRSQSISPYMEGTTGQIPRGKYSSYSMFYITAPNHSTTTAAIFSRVVLIYRP